MGKQVSIDDYESGPVGGRLGNLPVPVRLLVLLATLFVFFVAINLMGDALKALTKSYVSDLLKQAHCVANRSSCVGSHCPECCMVVAEVFAV